MVANILNKIFFRKSVIRILVISTLLLTALFFVLFEFIVKGEPYAYASQYIQSNNIVREKLGEINKTDLSFFSSLSLHGTKGNANYKIYVHGSVRKGVIYIDMEKLAGKWKVIGANLFLPDGEKIVLN